MSFDDEMRRQGIIERAVQAADRIIIDGCKDREELLLLTAMVAKVYIEKIVIQGQYEVVRKDFDELMT
jgi:hypothetical protein